MEVKIQYVKEERGKYLSEVIGNEYYDWTGAKILLAAPTGMGKTTFVVTVLLDYLRRRRKKLLILCNRRLLRMQYWYSLVERFINFEEIEKCVTIKTYQQLTDMIWRKVSLTDYFAKYAMIVCDECHYFYSDSDFNGFGTYALLQEIACAGALKTMIFMSATMEEVRPLIEQTIKKCLCRLSRTERNPRIKEENERVLSYDFSIFANFDRFLCRYVPDMKTLSEILLDSPKKSVIFFEQQRKRRCAQSGNVKITKSRGITDNAFERG